MAKQAIQAAVCCQMTLFVGGNTWCLCLENAAAFTQGLALTVVTQGTDAAVFLTLQINGNVTQNNL